MGDFFVTHTI